MTKAEELQNRIDTAIQLRDAAYRVCADYQRNTIELKRRLGDLIMACEVFAKRSQLSDKDESDIREELVVTAGEVNGLRASISTAKAKL